MAVKIKFDNTHNVIEPTLVLSTRSGRKLGAIPAVNISVSDSFNAKFDLAFDVNKVMDGTECYLWDKITNFRLVWCREWDVWFEIYVSISDEGATVKNVSAVSLAEAELGQLNLYNIEINTEDDIARDDYAVTVLYDADNSGGSLLDRILDKAPHYSISHVDASIAGIQRTFSFDGVSIYDAMMEIAEEIDCIFIFDNGTDDDGNIARSIAVYDLESYCVDCGHRDSFDGACPECGSDNVLMGYGDDTTVFVSVENLADSITYEVDTDSVKNCFRLEAGDDLMTATIINCNPNGNQYIWYITDEVKEDMSDELVEKLESYDELYGYYYSEHVTEIDEALLSEYNALAEKYFAYNEDLRTIGSITGYAELMNAYYDTLDFYLYLYSGLMPTAETSSTSAEEEAAKLTADALSPVAVTDLDIVSASTAQSAVLAVAKILVKSTYQVKVNESSLDGTTWTGNFKITNYSDDEDTAVSGTVSIEITDDYETYVEQKLEKALNSAVDEEEDGIDAVSLFALSLESFTEALALYGLVPLNTFADACQTCLDVLIEQGVADGETWADEDPDLYTELYLDYYYKLAALQAEIAVREAEIAVIAGIYDDDGGLEADGMQTVITAARSEIQEALDFEDYLGEELWLEFVAYRREDTYQNDNYISDGLDNSELFARALEFIEAAQKEAYKSATLQHSITANLQNLLVMKEFEPIVDYFSVGNWIRVKIDDGVYRLRLIYYSIEFDDLSQIQVEFSDVKKVATGVTDTESILSQAASMATSYSEVTRQASQGSAGNEQLQDWVEKGLSLTNMKIVSSADNQNITWDSHGILCREYDALTDDYSDKQLKIINHGLYVTDDAWLTSKAGIGSFAFYNPASGETEEAYGVIADTLVGNLILSEAVGIYNTQNSIVMDECGLTITADATSEGANNMVMTVQQKKIDEDGEEYIEQVMYLDGDGNLVLTGSLLVQTGSNDGVTTLNDVCDTTEIIEQVYAIVAEQATTIYDTIDETYQAVLDETTYLLEEYKAEVGQYMTFDDDGLTLGSTESDFKTVIDNNGMYFKEADTTVAYITNNQLYIPNAVIENTLTLGNFFFSPRADGGVSIVWQDD